MLIGYARVSTADQQPRLQLDALTTAGCKKIFSESVSGASRNRPQLSAALDHLREGDVLVVWKLDRLARSLTQLLRTAGDLKGRGVQLRSLTESIDTTTPAGRLFFHVMGALGEFEADCIRERTTAGLVAARKRGRIGGRPRALSPKQMRQALAMMKDRRISFASIAKTLGVGVTTLYRYFPGGRDGSSQ